MFSWQLIYEALCDWKMCVHKLKQESFLVEGHSSDHSERAFIYIKRDEKKNAKMFVSKNLCHR